MMGSYIGRIRKIGPLMGDVFLSAFGCFALMRGFRLAAMEKKESNTTERARAAGTPANNWRVSAPHSSFWPSSRVKLQRLL